MTPCHLHSLSLSLSTVTLPSAKAPPGLHRDRGFTRLHTQSRVATRAKIQFTRCAYVISPILLSHLNLICFLSIVASSCFTRKQPPINRVTCYYFINCGIIVFVSINAYITLCVFNFLSSLLIVIFGSVFNVKI
jgi:hypothetical protein